MRGGDASSNSTRCTRLRRAVRPRVTIVAPSCGMRVIATPQAGARWWITLLLAGRLPAIIVRDRGSNRLELPNGSRRHLLLWVPSDPWHDESASKTLSTICSRGRRCVLVWWTLQSCDAGVLISCRRLCSPVRQAAGDVAWHAFSRGWLCVLEQQALHPRVAGGAPSCGKRCTRV